MCGIVAIVRKGVHDLAPDINRALMRMRHRGPDDIGIWSGMAGTADDPYTIAMGHVRLSIIDLSPKGHQPMIDSSGNVIVYNGEIYNYLELRSELTELGHAFHTGTDTEVILASYRQWGIECVGHFIGMWAFAIWDGSRLFVSRDRLGKKPLYYYKDQGSGLIAFVSELKGFRDMPDIPWQPDELSVYRFLSFGEIESAGRTFFQGLKEFPAASILNHECGVAGKGPRRFWSLQEGIRDVDEDEAIRTTTGLLVDSVRLRLRSDAPLGLTLSGGLDSTLLLAVVNELGFVKPPVFSSMYSEPGYNEKEYFDIASRDLSCTAHIADTTVSEFVRDLDRLMYHLDQPSPLPGPFSLWQVSKLAHNHVKVLLDGQGPDELAGGYLYYFPALFHTHSLFGMISQAPDVLFTLWSNRHLLDQYSLRTLLNRLRGSAKTDIEAPFLNQWSERFADLKPDRFRVTELNTMLRRSVIETSLPGLLRYADRVNMAFSIENRCPYLDHRLVEYVTALPPSMKIRGGTTKWIFRRLAQGRIPAAILKRRLKMGFPTPVGEWYRHSLYQDCRDRLVDYRGLSWFPRWIDIPKTETILHRHSLGKVDHQRLLWRILAIGVWEKNHFTNMGYSCNV